MVTLLLIFRNIKNLEEVLHFYFDNISPIMHQCPGVIGTDLHSVSEISPDFPQELEGVQLITETYFESYETLAEMLSSSDGMEMMQLMEKQDVGDYYIYWTKVKRITGAIHASKTAGSHSRQDTRELVSNLLSSHPVTRRQE